MKRNDLLLGLLSCVLLISSSAFASKGKDPVSWSISPSGGFPANTTIGNSYAVTYTLTNNLPFSVALTVSNAYVGGSYTMTNGCNTTLASGRSCNFHAAFQPVKVGQNNIQFTMAYNKNRVPLPSLSSTSSSQETPDKVSGRVTSPLPPVTYVGTNYPVTFTFINNGKSAVTATSIDVSGFVSTSNTCNSTLNANSSCSVSGSITPSAPGQLTLGVTYNYIGGKVVLTTQSTAQSSGSCHHVEGLAALPLPVNTYQYADNVVKYTFTNHCDTSSESLGTVSLTSDESATITKGTDTCSGKTLAANASCTVAASVVPTQVDSGGSDLSVTATIPYSTFTASATTSGTVNAIPTPTTMHTVFIVNQCDQGVWYEFANGTGGTKSPDPTPANQRTFTDYQMDLQVTGSAPSTKVLTFDQYINGNIYGRTQCDFSNQYCLTANCPINSATDWSCKAGQGAGQPATVLENYMPSAVNSDGVYDVSIINGFNIPAEFKSLAPLSSSVFGCGQAAGATIQPVGSTLGACSWTFTPPSTGIDSPANFAYVSPGADDGCTSTCSPSTNTCGEGYASFTSANGGLQPFNRRCGTFLGYWQLGDFVNFSSSSNWGTVNLYNLYTLGATLPNGPNGSYGTINGVAATYSAIYTCPVPTSNGSLNTGYNANVPNACGCEQWSFTASSAPCLSFNSDWTSIALPRFKWLKLGCPTAYTYQYDDKSVSFQCDISQQKTSYQITFCPGGTSGRPA